MMMPVSEEGEGWTPETWMGDHRKKVQEMYDLVAQRLGPRTLSANKKLRELPLQVGDRVMVRNWTARRAGKLHWRWETTPYEVLQQPNPSIPVFKVKPKGANGPVRTVHRNMLRPCTFLRRAPEPIPESPNMTARPSGEEEWWVPPLPEPISLERREEAVVQQEENYGSPVEQTVELRHSELSNFGRMPARYNDCLGYSGCRDGHPQIGERRCNVRRYGCNGIYHEIPTGDAAPIRERYRQIPPQQYQEVKDLLNSMLENGVVRESQSPWAAPVVLVKKKDGSLRFCVDYRRLNSCTVCDSYPLPRIEESLTALGKARYFSSLDLASGYWQVPMSEKDKGKTAFILPMGLYEFNRMPFGLTNAPGTFQRLMEKCLGDFNFEFTLIYLDDIIVYSATFEDHLQKLGQVFRRLREHGLKLKPSKCRLLQEEIEYLGHRISGRGVQPSSEKIAAVRDWPTPTTLREVRAFLGLAGYYRRFVKDFAHKAEPLNALLRNTARGPKAQCVPWGIEQERAFQTLKDALTNPPILAYADYHLPFQLYTDASQYGLGAVLSQIQNGEERVIAYGSWSLRDSERNPANYSSFRLELLALVWAMTEKFTGYLTGAEVQVLTDNNPLAHLDNAKLGALEQRWMARLSKYRYSVKYRSKNENQNADALHTIQTGDHPPIKERHRPIPPAQYQQVKGLLQNMKDSGVIRDSRSPWAAPLVLVKKKDGTIRLCVDYRKLNDITHKDAYPLPRIEESLAALQSAVYFSVLDLTSGYWQVPMSPADAEKTAFTTPMGLFEFDRMPFGLCNAPATFQRLMEFCLGHLNFESVLLYLDDIIVYSRTYAEHLDHLARVFESLDRYGLKLKPSKCHLLKSEIQYLGHIVSADGVSPDPQYTERIRDWPTPETVKDIRRFLGFAGYYRRFVKNFARIAAPLQAVLIGQSTTRSGKSPTIQWTPEMQKAFEELKAALVGPNVLAYPDYSKPFILQTDASKTGLGAVLSQKQEGLIRPIAFASRSLRATERNDSNYSSFKLEFLALVWAVTEKFHHYLTATPFVAYTDNNPLTHLSTAKLGAIEQRPAFESELFQEFCNLYGCQKIRTTAYHPQGNGLCEKANQIIINMLRTVALND
ncbi:uncharacterized protein LOC142204512 [Leptodactylus fuscus]|uniref:uncharacterized protein LOC142204512 n=1 Tax=Leptodactylus fuscus TaxID=238119 RepID=UPI003F4F12A4